ncbi:hypothetical protein [Amycolatopsis keratiniphila]|uniref:Uncharacterized protein n=1 Tax=Amycolatopsis keratiniphila TaxID=129921 RepID=R4T603_9PSEU|nr:hypothetical protein [Amycolatopsis keratiniphila]AGM06412.1 hypothetical protein AORI_3827 [Amycolatopsis keratiniphila]
MRVEEQPHDLGDRGTLRAVGEVRWSTGLTKLTEHIEDFTLDLAGPHLRGPRRVDSHLDNLPIGHSAVDMATATLSGDAAVDDRGRLSGELVQLGGRGFHEPEHVLSAQRRLVGGGRGCRAEGRHGRRVPGDIVHLPGQSGDGGGIRGGYHSTVQSTRVDRLFPLSYEGYRQHGRVRRDGYGDDTVLVLPADPVFRWDRISGG